MKVLMEYQIIAGRVIETRRSWMKVRSAGEGRPGRAPRKAGNTSERKIKANEQSSVREAARILNATFQAGDAHVVLKYDPEHLPSDYEAAAADLKRFLGKIRYEFKKRAGRTPVLFWVTANWSPHRQAPARLHHHMVIEAAAFELARKLWEGGGFAAEFLDNRGDHSDLAAYLCENVHDRPVKKRWHASRNVERPIYTEPVPVADVEGLKPEAGAIIKEYTTASDEDGRISSSYMRCLLPDRPKVRGGKIIMPKPKRKGGGACG